MFFFSTYVKEIKIAIGDDVLSSSWFCYVNLHLGKFGPRPGVWLVGISIYVGAKGRYWSQISHRKLKISVSHDVVTLVSEPDAMLSTNIRYLVLK